MVALVIDPVSRKEYGVLCFSPINAIQNYSSEKLGKKTKIAPDKSILSPKEKLTGKDHMSANFVHPPAQGFKGGHFLFVL